MNLYLLIFFLLSLTHHISMSEGKPHRQKRMVLGEKAALTEWPFVVWLVKEKRIDNTSASNSSEYKQKPLKYCVGTLVRSRWVLTAAHCVEDIVNTPEFLRVHIGSEDRESMENKPKYHYNVSNIIIHSHYLDNKDKIPNDDIALIKLGRRVAVNQFSTIKPSRFALWKIGQANRKKYRCEAAGWGKSRSFSNVSEMYDNSEKPSKHLMKIDIPLLSRDDCIQKFNISTNNGTTFDLNMFWKKMMCGGSSDPSVGTACLHDSGSPLLCEDIYGNKEVHGVAIAIHGPVIEQKPCTPGKQIIVFLRISHYAIWILDMIKKNKGWMDDL